MGEEENKKKTGRSPQKNIYFFFLIGRRAYLLHVV